MERLGEQTVEDKQTKQTKEAIERVKQRFDQLNFAQCTQHKVDTQSSKPVTRPTRKSTKRSSDKIHLSAQIENVPVQHQHQMQQQKRQQQGMSIKPVWHKPILKKKQSNSVERRDESSQAKKTEFFTEQDIRAAISKEHQKLGDEICDYKYKDRNLLNLWKRLGGISESEEYGGYKGSRISHVSKNALLTMIRNPELFQYGVVREHLPSGFVFKSSEKEQYARLDFHREVVTRESLKERLNMSGLYQEKYDNVLSILTADNLISLNDLCNNQNKKSCVLLLEQFFKIWKEKGDEGFIAFKNCFIDKPAELSELLTSKGLVVDDFSHLLKLNKTQHMWWTTLTKTHLKGTGYCHFSELMAGFQKFLISLEEKGWLQDLPPNCTLFLIDNMLLYLRLVKEPLNKITSQKKFYSKIQWITYPLLFKTRGQNNTEVMVTPTTEDPFECVTIRGNFTVIGGVLRELGKNMRALSRVYHRFGLEACQLLSYMFTKIYRLQGKQGFLAFKKCFVDEPAKLTELLSDEGLDAFYDLLRLDEKQYQWWKTLTEQHLKGSGICHLSELMIGFKQFLTELDRMKLADALPEKCPLKGVDNMLVGLDRLRVMLSHASNPVEQLQRLEGVSLHACDAVEAFANGYYLATDDMCLTQKEEKISRKEIETLKEEKKSREKLESTDFIVIRDVNEHDYVENEFDLKDLDEKNAEQLFQYACREFYRNLGREEQINHYDFYVNIVEYIKNFKNPNIRFISDMTYCRKTNVNNETKLWVTIKEQPHGSQRFKMGLLDMVFHATTGARNMKSLPLDHAEQKIAVNRLIECFFRLVRKRESKDSPYFKHCENLIEFSNNCFFDTSYQLPTPRLFELYPNENIDNQLSTYPNLYELTYLYTHIDNAIESIPSSRYLEDYFGTLHVYAIKRFCFEQSKRNLKAYQHIFLKSIVNFHQYNKGSDFFQFLRIVEELRPNIIKGCEQAIEESEQQYYALRLKPAREAVKKYENSSSVYRSSNEFCQYINVIDPLKEKESKLKNNSLLKLKHMGQLFKLLSIVRVTYKSVDQVEKDFLKVVYRLKQHKDKKYFNHLVTLISSIVPRPNVMPHICLPDIILLLEELSKKINDNTTRQELSKNLHQLLNGDFDNITLELDSDDVARDEFYENGNKLEESFPGLGVFHVKIKAFLFEILDRDDKSNNHGQRNAFLRQLSQLSSKGCQQYVVKDLLELLNSPNWSGCSLEKVNQLLISVIKNSSQYKSPPIKLIAAIDGDILRKQTFPQHLGFINWCIKLPSQQVPQNLKIKIIKLSSLVLEYSEGIIAAQAMIFKIAGKNIKQAQHTFSRLLDLLEVAHQQDCLPDEIMAIINFASNGNQPKLDVIDNLLDTYHNQPKLLSKIVGHHSAILCKLLSHTLLKSEQELKIISNYLNKNSSNIKQLEAIYSAPPYPKAKCLLQLAKGEMTIKKFVRHHVRDPHQERDPKMLEKQFSTATAWNYIQKIQFPDEVAEADVKSLKQTIYQQLYFVNKIGNEKIRQMTIADIQAMIKKCRRLLTENPNRADKEALLLTSIAGMREIMYQTSDTDTPLWPTHVQMIALLIKMNNQIKPDSKRLFMKVASGEGKSLVTALSNVMAWCQGGPVVAVTHKRDLAVRDFKKYQLFYQALDIPCSIIYADTKPDEYHPTDGIHYTEFMDLANFRQATMINTGHDIFEHQKVNWELDEADAYLLHNKIDFNLTFSLTENGEESQHAWLFSYLMTDYIPQFIKQLVPQQGVITASKNHLTIALVSKFPNKAGEINSTEFQNKLDDWLKSAWSAYNVQENDRFVIRGQQETVDGVEREVRYAAVVMENDDRPMPRNMTFGGSIQQCLHTRLNQKAKNSKQAQPSNFTVAPEESLYSSMNAKVMMDWMIKNSKTMSAQSATPGSVAEKTEIKEKYEFTHIKLPKMEASKRTVHPDYFCQDQDEQFLRIKKLCQHYKEVNRPQRKKHALLIPVKDIKTAKALYRSLSKDLNKDDIQVFHAGNRDITDQELNELEKSAAESGKITIVTAGLVRRGFDPQPKKGEKHQVVVLHTHITTEVAYRQEKCRGSRIDPATGQRRKGKSIGIYDLESELAGYSKAEIDAKIALAYYHPQQFKQDLYQAHYNQEVKDREIRELEGETINVIQEDFYAIWKVLFSKLNSKPKRRNKILNTYGDCLSKIVAARPSVGEVKPTQQHIRQFNANALKQWAKAKTAMNDILKSHQLEDNINVGTNKLAETINKAQGKINLATSNAKSQTVQQQQEYKFYDKWREGLGDLPAYFKPGKQTWWQRIKSWFVENFWLDDNQLDALDKARRKAKHKIRAQQLEPWRITKKIEAQFMLPTNNSVEFEAWQKGYGTLTNRNKKMTAIKREAVIRISDGWQLIPTHNVTRTSTVIQSIDQGKTSTTIHYDPFDKGYQIQIESSDQSCFKQLEKALQVSLQVKGLPIPEITCEKIGERVLAKVNFNDNTYKKQDFAHVIQATMTAYSMTDSQNRAFWNYALRQIHEAFVANDKSPMPTVKQMQNVINKVNDFISNKLGDMRINEVPFYKAVREVLNSNNKGWKIDSDRKSLYSNFFKKLVTLAKEHNHAFFANPLPLSERLEHYAIDVHKDGKMKTINRFDNLSDDLNQHLQAVDRHAELYERHMDLDCRV